MKNNEVILKGKRDKNNGSWNIPLKGHTNTNSNEKQIKHQANALIQDGKTKQELAQFYHACTFSSVSSTWIEAIKNNYFQRWPGLTAELICKHIPKSMETAKGYTKTQRQGIQSTRKEEKGGIPRL